MNLPECSVNGNHALSRAPISSPKPSLQGLWERDSGQTPVTLAMMLLGNPEGSSSAYAMFFFKILISYGDSLSALSLRSVTQSLLLSPTQSPRIGTQCVLTSTDIRRRSGTTHIHKYKKKRINGHFISFVLEYWQGGVLFYLCLPHRRRSCAE